jgi:drug/metabolite transporter (DMT)-like permease
LLLPLAAAILTGINHPIRRYVLIMAKEPLFFSALMGTVSLGLFLCTSPCRCNPSAWFSYPVWSLIQARIFLRDVESVNWKVIAGIFSVVAGNFAIHLSR